MHQEEEPVEETVAVPEGEADEQLEQAESMNPTVEYVPAISVANREFIRNNYKKLDMQALCMATQLPPELVAMYIEAYEDYVKKNGGSDNDCVNFIMMVNTEGVINFRLQLPSLEKTEKILPNLGKAMYLLQNGKLRESTVQFFINMGEEKGNYRTIKQIVNGWKEAEKEAGQAPLVGPHEVLSGGV